MLEVPLVFLTASKSHLNAGKIFYTRPSLFLVLANRGTTHIEFVDACCRQNCIRQRSEKVRLSASKKTTVESREVGLTGTEYQKSARENYTHSSMRLVTFALCYSPSECNFVGNTRPRTRCV